MFILSSHSDEPKPFCGRQKIGATARLVPAGRITLRKSLLIKTVVLAASASTPDNASHIKRFWSVRRIHCRGNMGTCDVTHCDGGPELQFPCTASNQ